jgi:hypothetical protein
MGKGSFYPACNGSIDKFNTFFVSKIEKIRESIVKDKFTGDPLNKKLSEPSRKPKDPNVLISLE